MSWDARMIIALLVFTMAGLFVGYEQGKRTADRWYSVFAPRCVMPSGDMLWAPGKCTKVWVSTDSRAITMVPCESEGVSQ